MCLLLCEGELRFLRLRIHQSYLSILDLTHRDYEKAYELETDEDALKDIKLKVKKVSTDSFITKF